MTRAEYDASMQIDPEKERRLHELVTVFLAENAKLNLTAFRTEETCWIGNILDSLSFLDIVSDFPDMKSLLDLGTGGGFPLLPLAIMLPDVICTGLDSMQKKIAAVERIVQQMSLQNVRCLLGRAEELGRSPQHREQYDVVTIRAVAELPILLEYAAAFVKVKGRIVVWKSMTIDKELQESLLARAELSCHLIAKHAYELSEGFGKRQLLIFEKTSPLLPKFPRGVGVPKKQPLK